MCVTEYSDLFLNLMIEYANTLYVPYRELSRMAGEVWHIYYATYILHGRRSLWNHPAWREKVGTFIMLLKSYMAGRVL